MRLDKFPNRVKAIISEFEEKENQKRWRFLVELTIPYTLNGKEATKKRTLVVSRFEVEGDQVYLKYKAQSKSRFLIRPIFIEKISDIQLEKVNVIRKKLGLRAPIKRRDIERDEHGIPIKKPRKQKVNKELSELEFKAMFDPRYITDEERDKLFEEKDLQGRMEIVKKNFKKIKPEFQDVIDEFNKRFEGLDIENEHYKRDNYGGLSLIVGKVFTNMRQLDPRFKAYKSFTVIHRLHQPFIKIVQNSVKGGTDTVFYLINPDTMVKINKWNRYRNRG